MTTLFDTLIHSATDDSEQGLVSSISAHLQHLLNARCGVLQHLPDYGLPDLNRFYRELPYSELDLAQTVKKLIEKYEPRVRFAYVKPLARDLRFCIVHLDIKVQLHNGQQIAFSTLFKSSGEAEVRVERDYTYGY